MMRVTTEDVPLVVVVDGRGCDFPTCFNLPPAVIPSTAQRFPRANDNPGECWEPVIALTAGPRIARRRMAKV